MLGFLVMFKKGVLYEKFCIKREVIREKKFYFSFWYGCVIYGSFICCYVRNEGFVIVRVEILVFFGLGELGGLGGFWDLVRFWWFLMLLWFGGFMGFGVFVFLGNFDNLFLLFKFGGFDGFWGFMGLFCLGGFGILLILVYEMNM